MEGGLHSPPGALTHANVTTQKLGHLQQKASGHLQLSEQSAKGAMVLSGNETERASAHAAIQNADDAMAACSVAGAEAEQCTQQLEASGLGLNSAGQADQIAAQVTRKSTAEAGLQTAEQDSFRHRTCDY
eukprot:6472527-Amphidinium_carterae.1